MNTFDQIETELQKNNFHTRMESNPMFIRLVAKNDQGKVVNVYYDNIKGIYIVAFGSIGILDKQETFPDALETLEYFNKELSAIRNDYGEDLKNLV